MAPRKKAPDAAQPGVIPKLEIENMLVTIEGMSPLIVHAFGQKKIDDIEHTQTGKPSVGRKRRNPFSDFVNGLHWMTPMPAFPFDDASQEELMEIFMANVKHCKFGVRADGVKASMVTACTMLNIHKTDARKWFFINEELLQIEGSIPELRRDTVRLASGVADLRYRPQFTDWQIHVPISFNARMITHDQIANIINAAGFSVGLCEWRPEKDGSFGRFRLMAE